MQPSSNLHEKKLIQVSNIQPQLEKLITKNYFLNISAKEAYKVTTYKGQLPPIIYQFVKLQAYVRAYESHSLKQIYDVQSLCLKAVGQSFG